MGVLGRDLETKYFPNGGSITAFSIATTEWHRIATSNRLADFAIPVPQEREKGLYRGFIAYPKVERPKWIRKGNNRDLSRCAAITLVNSLLSLGLF